MSDSGEIVASVSSKVIGEDEVLEKENTFTIILATDIHLGHQMENEIRCDDTFITFEEILETTKEKEADFLLLGGDLFDRNVPEIYIMSRTVELLTKYVEGEKRPEFKLVSPAAESFGNNATCMDDISDPNWRLDWMNTELPILTIHGNHDNPVGEYSASAVDTLASLGLLSHFGRILDSNHVILHPVTLQKGKTTINIWGWGSVKDEKINGLIMENRVRFVVPQNVEDDFNILVLHQNRVKRGPSNLSFFHEKYIPKFIDFVLWGHEHDNRISLEYCPEADCLITQPGSTVPTSLCEGEAGQKSIGMIIVNQNRFRFKAIPLETTRLVIFDNVQLLDMVDCDDLRKSDDEISNKMKTYLHSEIEKHLRLAADECKLKPRMPKAPLLRLRVIMSHPDCPTFNAAAFATSYKGRIANSDIILFKKTYKEKKDAIGVMIDDDHKNALNRGDNQKDLMTYVEHFLSKTRAMTCLSERAVLSLANAIIEMRSTHGKVYSFKMLTELIDAQLEQSKIAAINYLKDKKAVDEKDIERFFQNRRQEERDNYQDDLKYQEIMENIESYKISSVKMTRSSESEEDELPQKKRVTSTRGRGRGRGRGRKKTVD